MGIDDHENIKKLTDYWKLVNTSRDDTRSQRAWKKEHDDRVPAEVWVNNLENNGSYSCVEIIPYDPNTGTVYLKKRFDPNAGRAEKENWEGRLHIPGLSNLKKIRGDEILSILLKKEIIRNPDYTDSASTDLKFVTEVKYPEPERRTVAVTLELALPIDPSLLQEDFVPVKRDNIDQVITQHQPMIEAFWKGNLPLTMDTRPQ